MIILFGLAGSGKGTQGKALAEIFGWRWMSVGEVIRQTGKYKELTDRGGLVPDEEVIKLMGAQIDRAEDEGFEVILDGYPRDLTQAEYIVEHYQGKIDGAIILEVPKEELLARLALRGRDDDKEMESIERRFEIFEQNITPIVALFGQAGIRVDKVDGTGKIEEVTERLVKVVKEMNSDATEQIDDVNGGEIERSYGE